MSSSIDDGATPELMEKALENAAQQSRANMERIQQQKLKSLQGTAAIASSSQPKLKPASSVRSVEFASDEVPKRPSSAPRMMPAARAAMASSSAAAYATSSQHQQLSSNNISSTNNINHNMVNSSTSAGANNSNASTVNVNIIRKFQLLEEKIRKLEKSQGVTDQTVQEAVNKVDLLSEAHKQEKKMILGFKEQLASTRTRMDLLSNQEDLRQKATQSSSQTNTLPFGLDGEMLQELINQKVQRAVEDALIQQRLLLQHSTSTHLAASVSTDLNAKSSNLTASQTSLPQNPGTTIGNQTLPQPQQKFVFDSLATIEREILKISSEVDRIKTKQIYLDRVYTEIKEASNVKEMKRDEHHRKQLQHFRQDIDQIVEKATQRMNEIHEFRESQGEEIIVLQKALEEQVNNVGTVFAEFDLRILEQEKHGQSIANAQVLMQTKVQSMQDRFSDMEDTLPKIFVQEMETQLHPVHQSIDMLSKQHDLQQEKLLEVSLSTSQLGEQLDGITAGPITLLSASIDRMKEAFDAEIKTIQGQIVQDNRTTDDNLLQITQNFKKWKSRVKELHGTVTILEEKQVNIDRLAGMLEQQREEDAKTTYEWHTKLQRLEEKQLEIVLEHAQHMRDVSGMIDNALQDIEVSLKRSMEAQNKSQEEFKEHVSEATMKQLNNVVPTIMSQLLEQSPWSDFHARLTQQEELQSTLLQELQEFQRIMQESVARQQQSLQQRLVEDETARKSAMSDLHRVITEEYKEDVRDVLQEVRNVEMRTVDAMKEMGKESILNCHNKVANLQGQLVSLSSTVNDIGHRLDDVVQKQNVWEKQKEDEQIEKERREKEAKAQEEESKRQKQEEQEKEREREKEREEAELKKHEEETRISSLLLPSSSESVVTSLHDFHLFMERVQSDIQALDHHSSSSLNDNLFDATSMPKSAETPTKFSNFSSSTAEPQLSAPKTEDKGSNKIETITKKPSSRSKRTHRSQSHHNRRRSHHSSKRISSSDSDSDVSDSDASDKTSTSSSESDTEEERRFRKSKRNEKKSSKKRSKKVRSKHSRSFRSSTSSRRKESSSSSSPSSSSSEASSNSDEDSIQLTDSRKKDLQQSEISSKQPEKPLLSSASSTSSAARAKMSADTVSEPVALDKSKNSPSANNSRKSSVSSSQSSALPSAGSSGQSHKEPTQQSPAKSLESLSVRSNPVIQRDEEETSFTDEKEFTPEMFNEKEQEDVEDLDREALDEWDHIEFAGASSSLPTSPARENRISSTAANSEREIPANRHEEDESRGEEEASSLLNDTDFDPERIMQMVIEKRRQLRSQLRPELFGTTSSQLMHHLPVTPHEHTLSTTAARRYSRDKDLEVVQNLQEAMNNAEESDVNEDDDRYMANTGGISEGNNED